MKFKFWLISALSLLCLNKLFAQETMINGFADVDFSASDQPSQQAFFSLGQYDLCRASGLNDRLSFSISASHRQMEFLDER